MSTSTDGSLTLAPYRKVTYDLSVFVNNLGYDFLAGVRRVICRVRDEQDLEPQTWRENYANPTVALCEYLVNFITHERAIFDVMRIDLELCNTFFDGVLADLRASARLEKTAQKKLAKIKHVAFCLAASGILPPAFMVKAPIAHRARMGTSRFTVPNRKKQTKKEPDNSEFAFFVPQHGRGYDFSLFVGLGHTFVSRFSFEVKHVFIEMSAGDAKNAFEVATSFFRHLLKLCDEGQYRHMFELIRSGQFANVTDIDWESIVFDWAQSQLEGANTTPRKRKLVTASMNVQTLKRLWDALIRRDFFPVVNFVRAKGAKSRANRSPRKSLAQLSHSAVMVAGAVQGAIDELSKFFAESGQGEVAEYIRALSAEMPAQEVQSLNSHQLVQKIRTLNLQRLKDLRDCAEHDFIKWYDHWEEGQFALRSVTNTAEFIVDMVDSPLRSVSERRRNVMRLLKSHDPRTNLGNSLKLVVEVYGGILTGISGRYHHLKREFGGKARFCAYLHAHAEATVALWIMLLIDSGANCEVVREMPLECLEDAVDPLMKTVVFAPKARAGGKIIVDQLPISAAAGHKLSCVAALEKYRRMTALYRSKASGDCKDRLFFAERDHVMVEVDEWKMRNWFVDFLQRHEKLKTLAIRPSMIRPSVLMDVRHASPDGIVAAQLIADHRSASTTNQSYTGGFPTKLENAVRIREFQQRFQAVVIVSISGAAEKLGLTPAQFDRIFSEAARTGLGVACLDGMAGIQPGTKRGSQCSKFEACNGCEMSWVVATTANICDLILFNDYLDRSQESAIQRNSELWEKKWLPWLVFSEIALAKLSQGETAAIYRDAVALAELRKATYQPIPLD